MSTLKVVDRWWSKRAHLLLGGVLLVLATMTVMLYIGQLQSASTNTTQAEQISSLARALDEQREAAREGGADVVVPPSDEIKEDPAIIQGARGEKGDTGEPGATGPSGSPGQDGADGRNGSPGPSGSPGEPGRDGVDGAPGQPGADGEDGVGQVGPSGPSGPAGRDGTDGQDGKDGEDGKSVTSLRIPIGPVTYYCTPKEPGSTDFECTPEVGNDGPEASASRRTIPVHPAAILPALVALRPLRRMQL